MVLEFFTKYRNSLFSDLLSMQISILLNNESPHVQLLKLFNINYIHRQLYQKSEEKNLFPYFKMLKEMERNVE